MRGRQYAEAVFECQLRVLTKRTEGECRGRDLVQITFLSHLNEVCFEKA